MKPKLSIALLLAMFPGALFAHSVGDGGGFSSGFNHPVLGFDHLLAMVSVGIISAQLGGRAVWTVPSVFVCFMLVGGLLGMNDIPLMSVETGIAFSVLALGLVMAIDKKLPAKAAMVFVAFFAIFHGHAHGTEMPQLVRPVLYSMGFISGTAAIHIAGVFIGLGAFRIPRGQQVLRLAGAAIAATGLFLLVG